jgi:hypothetical protein
MKRRNPFSGILSCVVSFDFLALKWDLERLVHSRLSPSVSVGFTTATDEKIFMDFLREACIWTVPCASLLVHRNEFLDSSVVCVGLRCVELRVVAILEQLLYGPFSCNTRSKLFHSGVLILASWVSEICS